MQSTMDIESDVRPIKETIFDKELRVVIYIQNRLSPCYDYPSIILHYLLREDILMLIGPISIFLFNYYIGIVLTISCLIVEIVTGIFKWACRVPRPLWMDTNGQLQNRKGEWEQDYGFPSSHSSLTTSMFMIGLLAYINIKSDMHFMVNHFIDHDRNVYLIYACVCLLLSFLTSLSRIYLAVHYPRDVIVGYFLGIFLGLLTYYLIKETRDINPWISIVIGISLTVISILLMIIVRPLCPQDKVQMLVWESNAFRSWNAKKKENILQHPIGLHPRSISRYLCCYGILLGAWISDPIYRLSHYGHSYDECQQWTKTKGIRFGIGMSGVLFLLTMIYIVIPKIIQRKLVRYSTITITCIVLGLWLALIPQLIFHSYGYNKC